MNTETLPDDPLELKAVIADKDQLLADTEQVISELKGRVRLLESMIYGSKSEKRKSAEHQDQQQLSLFDEAEATIEVSPEVEGIVTVPAHQRKKRGRRPLPENLPREEVIHDIPEEDKVCPCGCHLTRIGEEVSEKLDVIPARMRVIRHIRPKYACRACEGVEDDGPTVKIAPMEPQVINQSIVTPGLLAEVLASKFVDAQPFYRQEAKFARLGVDISRATMCNWALLAGRAVEPVMDLLLQELRTGPVLGLDETPVQVLQEEGRANTTKSYVWVARGGPPGKPAVYFHYAPSRSGTIAKELVGNFRGYVQSDGYVGYDDLAELPGVVLQGCMAHMRRKFMDVIKAAGRKKPRSDGGLADYVLERVGQLYAIEDEARKRKLKPEAVHELREARARPLLDDIKKRLDARAANTPPKSQLGKAITYARNQWSRIIVYLDDGRLRPDNNLVENAIRPFAVGRKNWLFSGSPRGAKASSAIYSLIETAKANGLEPYAYLRFLFERLPYARCEAERRALLPQHVSVEQLRPLA